MKRRSLPSPFNITCFPRSGSSCSTPPRVPSCRSAWGLRLPKRAHPCDMMNQLLDDLIKVMTLERLEMNLFRGESRDIGSPQVFGGQVLGQALVAATRDGGGSHGALAARLFPAPRGFQFADRLRGRPRAGRQALLLATGGRHSARAADLQYVGLLSAAGDRARPSDHRYRMCRRPRRCPTWNRTIASLGQVPPARAGSWSKSGPSNFGRCSRPILRREKSAPLKYVWFRAVDKLADDEALHRCLLAYVSDFHLLDTALKPHGVTFASPN